MLPLGDHTPSDYALPLLGWREKIKRPLRRRLYPLVNAINHPWLARRYATSRFSPDLWLWGQRGNDYERQRRRVNALFPLQGRDILIAGCGTGRDVDSWLPYRPRRVLGVDWFSYDRAWGLWKEYFAKSAPNVALGFAQANLERLEDIPDKSFDVIGSDAVFEHLKNLPQVLQQFHRVLRPGGLLYATFGPLWFGWGGDHVSGYDTTSQGFNHLLLSESKWHAYLAGFGQHEHSEHDGRTWIEHDLFSRLRPIEYLDALAGAGFKRRFVAAIVDPRAIDCLRQPVIADALLGRFDQLDLVVSGMTVIYQRP